MIFNRFPNLRRKLVPAEEAAPTGVETPPQDLKGFESLEIGLLRSATDHDRKNLKYPVAYPEEVEAVKGFSEAVKTIWNSKQFEYARYLFQLAFSFKGGPKGVESFIYGKLAGLISELSSGNVKDFDTYRDCEYGDSTLALLAKYGAGLRLMEQKTPKLERQIFYPDEKRGEESLRRGAILFICGYGATLRPYEGIFEHMNLPIVAYQLPHSVISADIHEVGKAFDTVYAEIANDPLLRNVTHVIGNSTGTMFASRLALDVCAKEPRRNLKVALIQTGTSWPEAMKRTKGKFAREVETNLRNYGGKNFDDFENATRKYNPIDMADGLAEVVDKGQVDLSFFVGLGDKLITPASEVVDPLFDKLDSGKARGKYTAFSSRVAGHNAAVLFFLWLSKQKATEWARVFKGFDPEKDAVRMPEELAHHHVRSMNTEKKPVSEEITF